MAERLLSPDAKLSLPSEDWDPRQPFGEWLERWGREQRSMEAVRPEGSAA